MATFDFEGFILKYSQAVLNDNGLTLVSRDEMIESMQENYKSIYGTDINLNSGSPDQTFIQNQVQNLIDIQQYINYLYASLDVSKSRGYLLDSLCRLNNVFRKGATNTIQLVDVFVDSDITLNGVSTTTPFIVQDNIGNQYVLSSTINLTANTTNSLEFQSVLTGAIQSDINTITIQTTLTNGVVSVNNSNPPLTIGITEESDPSLRLRRELSTSLAGAGGYQTLSGSLLQISSVSSLYLDNNPNGTVNANGTPAHGIHLIIIGGSDEEIANVMLEKLNSNGCCDRIGNISYAVPVISASPFIAKWDVPTQQPLFIRFSIQPLVEGASFNLPTIKNNITTLLTPGIYEEITTAQVINVAQLSIASGGGNGSPVSMELSTDGVLWKQTVKPDSIEYQFAVTDSNIEITVLSYPPTSL